MILKNTCEFRPIAITEPSKMLLDKITVNRLKEAVKINKQQIGFKERRSIGDHIINLEALIREIVAPIIIQLDLQKAYNSINRGKLYLKMIEADIEPGLVETTKMSIENIKMVFETVEEKITAEMERGLPTTRKRYLTTAF